MLTAMEGEGGGDRRGERLYENVKGEGAVTIAGIHSECVCVCPCGASLTAARMSPSQ